MEGALPHVIPCMGGNAMVWLVNPKVYPVNAVKDRLNETGLEGTLSQQVYCG